MDPCSPRGSRYNEQERRGREVWLQGQEACRRPTDSVWPQAPSVPRAAAAGQQVTLRWQSAGSQCFGSSEPAPLSLLGWEGSIPDLVFWDLSTSEPRGLGHLRRRMHSRGVKGGRWNKPQGVEDSLLVVPGGEGQGFIHAH